MDERCDRHVGEVHPPRCAECDALNTSRPVDAGQPDRAGFIDAEPWAPWSYPPNEWDFE